MQWRAAGWLAGKDFNMPAKGCTYQQMVGETDHITVYVRVLFNRTVTAQDGHLDQRQLQAVNDFIAQQHNEILASSGAAITKAWASWNLQVVVKFLYKYVPQYFATAKQVD